MERTYIHIPEDLLVKIFLPQPVKSLVQWRCVCKLWNQVITSKSFIKSYGAHQKTSTDTNIYLLLNYRTDHSQFLQPQDFTKKEVEYVVSYYSASPIDRKSYEVLKSYNDICCRDSSEFCLEVYGICHGLLCLSTHDYLLNLKVPIFLYNPIIKKGKKLIPPDPTRGFGQGTRHTSLCFGYHDDDYKVVKIDAFSQVYEVYVYSLNTDSWKFVKVEVNAGTSGTGTFKILPYPKTKLVKGVAYFLRGRQVISFDLSREIIQNIKCPADITYSVASKIIMEEYGESIALIGSIFYDFINDDYEIHNEYGVVLWVLEQSDNSYTWEKQFIVQESYMLTGNPAVQAMGGFINNNELVIRTRNQHHEFILHNIENGFQQKFQIPEEQAHGKVLRRIGILTESLVLLTEANMPPFPWKWRCCNKNAYGDVQAVTESGIIGPLVSKATSGGTHEQIKFLVSQGCIKPLCDLLNYPDPRIVTAALKGLENILKVGEAEKNLGHTGNVNVYAKLMVESEGLEKIENLQSHDNNEIYEDAMKLLETYWLEDFNEQFL